MTWALPQRETDLRKSADRDLPVLALADAVSRVVADLIESIRVDTATVDRTASELREHALWFMAILGLRALRAAMQCLRSGYEDQAMGHQRLIDELHNRARKVRGDHSGNYARQWLEGRGRLGKGAKLAGQDFWEFMSPVHANSRAVFDWLAISQPDGSTKLVFGPERRPEMVNAGLTYMASELRDIGYLLALEGGRLLDVAALDAHIHEAFARWVPEEDAR